MTFDATSRLARATHPAEAPNFRTPALDLDSVYGAGPVAQQELYDAGDPIKLKIERGGVFEDLPRRSDGAAIIGDPRNDEHTIIAGLHCAFLLLHNRAVDYVREQGRLSDPMDVFAKARRLTTWHYHWLILHEFLPQIVGRRIVADVLRHGRRFYRPRPELALEVRNRTSDANQGVINIRACTTQVDDRIAAANDSQVTQQGTALKNALSAVENELYQTRLRSNQDPLNFPIKLNNKIATLRSVIESIDSQPTDQTHEVFDLLNGQLATQLDRLAAIVANDVPSFNALLASHSQPPITCSAVIQAGATAAAPPRAEGGAARTGARARIGRHVG